MFDDRWTPSPVGDVDVGARPRSRRLAAWPDEPSPPAAAEIPAAAPEAPASSAEDCFRIAANLVESAAATIAALQVRVVDLESERDRFALQAADLESMLSRWREIALELKNRASDLEGKLTQANRRAIDAEIRAENAEEDIANSRKGSHDLCDRVIAAFGSGRLGEERSVVLRQAAGSC